MIISTAAFTENEKIKEELIKSDKARKISLNIAYNIPGYKEAARDTRRYIYDAIREKVFSLM